MQLLLIDDHKIIRDGLKQIIQYHFPRAKIDDCSTAEDGLKALLTGGYSLVICDLSMPGRNGLDVLKMIKDAFPDLPVLVLSMLPEEQYAIRALRAGASGFISKASGGDGVIEAINRVLLGRKYIPAHISDLLAENIDRKLEHPHQSLSDRELHVFTLIAEGVSISEISKRLNLSQSTVSTHRARILRKLQMTSNAELTRYAIDHRMI